MIPDFDYHYYFIEKKLIEFMIDNNVSQDDMKKHGQRFIQPSSGKEAYFYKDQCIMTIEDNSFKEGFGL